MTMAATGKVTGGLRHLNQAMKTRVKHLGTDIRYKNGGKMSFQTRAYIHTHCNLVTLVTRGTLTQFFLLLN